MLFLYICLFYGEKLYILIDTELGRSIHMNQQTEQLFSGIAYSYGEYINAYLELLNNSLFFSTPYFDEETYQIQEELKGYFLDLPNLLLPQSSKKESCATRLLCIREIIEEKYRTLIAYQRELTLLLTLKQNDPAFTDNYFEAIGLTDVTASEMDFNQLATDCTNFIFEGTSGIEKQKRASNLLPYIPIKITKSNYVHYVEKSIKHIAILNQESSAEYLVSILKQLFDGKLYTGYGKHFTDIKDSLDHLSAIEDTEELFEEANLLNETLENCLEMLESMFRMICTFSNLIIFDKLEFNELTEMHAAFFDLYYSIKNIVLKSEDASLILASLPERIEEIQKELYENYKKASKEVLPDSLFALMQTYLNMNMQQIFGFSTAKHSAYSKEVLDILKKFTTELEEMLHNLPMLERKYRMQYFISQIPFVMSKENFDAYVHQAFHNLSQLKPNLLVAAQLTGILEENHFFPAPADIPVMETNYEEDDEAARFIAEHAELFKEDTYDTFDFFGDEQ